MWLITTKINEIVYLTNKRWSFRMVALRFILFCGVLSLVMAGDYEECFKEVGSGVEYRGLSFYSAAELEVSQYGDLEMEFEVVNWFFPLPCIGKVSDNGIYIHNSSTGFDHLLNYGPVMYTTTKTARRVMVQLETYGRLDFPVIHFKNVKIYKPQPMTTSAPVVKKSNSSIMLIAVIVIIIAIIVLSVFVGVCWYAKQNKQPSTVKSDVKSLREVKKSLKKNSFDETTSSETTESGREE
ncbi:hypothetical protein M3Y96_00315200 [Aphelenchoides besseyi]|nr:hypothetical protein M3Y96_00315200 [Aphelenchoides besseyi]